MAELDPEVPQPVESAEIVEPILVEEAAPQWNVPPSRPRNVYAGMWGPPEIAVVSIGALAILISALLYFFFVLPSDRELAKNKADADRLDAEVISATAKYGEITDSETQVAKLIGSADDFETRFLPTLTTGQSALYQRLNGLIRAYGLENTTGPDYAPLELANISVGQQTEEDKGRSRFRSLYPGVYVTTTVEGSYQNLRRFIREIETGREFIVISAVELAPSESETPKDENVETKANKVDADPNTLTASGKKLMQPGNPGFAQVQPQEPSANSKGKTHGQTVSLHLEMAAYFRRPGFVPMSAAPPEE